jgi:hypothetical protein
MSLCQQIEAFIKGDRWTLSTYVRNVFKDHVVANRTKAMTNKLSEEGSSAMAIFPPPEL